MTKAVPGSTSGFLWRSETFNRQRPTFRSKVGVSMRTWRDTTEPWNQVENTFLQVGEGKNKNKSRKVLQARLECFYFGICPGFLLQMATHHINPQVTVRLHARTRTSIMHRPPPPPRLPRPHLPPAWRGGNQGQLTSLAAGEDTAPSVAMARPDSSSSKAPTSAVFVL